MNTYQLIRAAILTILCGYCPLSSAYTQQAPLLNQTASAIKVATRQGAAQLIQRLTGDSQRDIPQGSLAHTAEQWLDAYSIEKNSRNSSYPWLLNARYSTPAVNQWLKAHHLTRWPLPRPTIAVSLKTNQDTPVTLDSDTWQHFTDTAKQLDIPIEPLALNTLNSESLNTQPHPILIGILPEAGQPEQSVTWAFYEKGQWSNWESLYSPSYVSDALAIVSKHLRKQPIKKIDTPPSAITLSIDHIKSVDSYVAVMHSLQSLKAVNSLNDDGIKNDRLLITLITGASISDIKTALDHLTILTASDSPTQADLSYHFQANKPVPTQTHDASEQSPPPSTTPQFAFLTHHTNEPTYDPQ